VRRADGCDETLAADFVVDCTGRGSRAPTWLAAWGFDAPQEERVEVGIRYVTAHLRREPGHAPGIAALIFAATPDLPRPGVLLAQEPVAGGPPRWVVTLAGYAGDAIEPTIEGMRQRARTMGDRELIALLDHAELLGLPTTFAFPHSERRRYERLGRFPERFLVMGDALASFNPIYGQGMTVAVCEALALRAALAKGFAGAHRRFFSAAAKVVDVPWQTAVGGDLAIAGADLPGAVRFVNRYLARVLQAAASDSKVALAFAKVAHLIAAPASLFAPNIVARVLWHSGRPPSDSRLASVHRPGGAAALRSAPPRDGVLAPIVRGPASEPSRERPAERRDAAVAAVLGDMDHRQVAGSQQELAALQTQFGDVLPKRQAGGRQQAP